MTFGVDIKSYNKHIQYGAYRICSLASKCDHIRNMEVLPVMYEVRETASQTVLTGQIKNIVNIVK
jgi:hypothetical protein